MVIPVMRRTLSALALLAGGMAAALGQSGGQPVMTGAAAPCGGDAGQVRLRVTLTGLRNDHGMAVVTVYGDNPAEFLAPGKKLARLRAPVRAGTTELCLAVPPRSSYAIAAYHDENGDRDFNRNLLGSPTEGYGVSNDAPTVLGIPSYDKARFTAGPGDNRLSIALRY